jgi:hypothetical protein
MGTKKIIKKKKVAHHFFYTNSNPVSIKLMKVLIFTEVKIKTNRTKYSTYS